MVLPRVLYVRVVETREIGIAKLDCKALNYVNIEYAARRTYDISYIQRKCTADMTSVGLAQARPNYSY